MTGMFFGDGIACCKGEGSVIQLHSTSYDTFRPFMDRVGSREGKRRGRKPKRKERKRKGKGDGEK